MTASPALTVLSGAVAAACGHPSPRAPHGAVDWDEVLALAARHHVVGQLDASGWARAHGAPEDVRERIAGRVRAQTFFTLLAASTHRTVLGALRAAGVAPLVLKGAVLAREAYARPEARMATDIDLLVPADGVGRAVTALQAEGFEWVGWRRPEDLDREQPGPAHLDRMADLPLLRDVTLRRDGVRVEIHWRLFENRRLMPVEERWFAEPRVLLLDGLEVATLPLADHWAYANVHGTRHLWSLMKWAADVAALAVRHPELVDPAALDRVGAGPRRSVATGLLVAEATFGPFLDPAARAWVQGVRGTQILRRRSLGALRAPQDRPKTVTPLALAGEIAPRLAARGDTAFRLEELRLLLLVAGRAQGVENPGFAELAGGPLRWVRRTARRLARRAAEHPLGRASWADRVLLVEAAVCLGAARAAVVLLPFRVLARGLGVHMAESPVSGAPPTDGLRRISWAIGAISVRSPWRSKCLEQALAAKAMLRRRGVPNTLYLGVARGENGVEAHAWLRTGTVHVTGGRDTSRYGVVSTFADAP